MPTAVAVTQRFEGRADVFWLEPFNVARQANLLNEQEKVFPISNQPLNQALVNRQVLRRRILEEHAPVFAITEQLNFLEPD